MVNEGNLEGVFAHNSFGDDGEESFSLIRFYNDGTVISSGFGECSLTDDWPKIKQWFHRDTDNEKVGIGAYTIEGRII